MPDITLTRGHTAVLIADYYTDMMNTRPHALERGVVEKGAAAPAPPPTAVAKRCFSVTAFLPGGP